MNSKVVVFYPHNPFSPIHGSHLRCLQQIQDISNNYSVLLLSSRSFSDVKWPLRRTALARLAKDQGIEAVYIFENSFLGLVFTVLSLPLRLFLRLINRSAICNILTFLRYPFILFWFTLIAFRHNASALIVHYSSWSFLTLFLPHIPKVLELHDVLPINAYLARLVASQIDKSSTLCDPSSEQLIHYITSPDQLPNSVLVRVEKICSQINSFNRVWMISSREQNLLSNCGMTANSDLLYPIVKVGEVEALATLPPILPIGPNPFNSYSLIKFIENVVPLLDPALFSHGKIQVTGRYWRNQSIKLPPHLEYLGLVNDYASRLAKSLFVIAPTTVGTGQQVKVFEAIAAGIPVVVYSDSVSEDLLIEYPGILAVDTPADFAAKVSELIVNRDYYSYCLSLARQSADRQKSYLSSFPYSRSLYDVISSSAPPSLSKFILSVLHTFV